MAKSAEQEAADRIKQLEALAAKTKELGRAEQAYQTALKNGNRIRKDTKRFEDALYQATYNLEMRHESLLKSSDKLTKDRTKQTKITKLLQVESARLAKVISTSTSKREINKAIKQQKIFNDKVKESRKLEKKLSNEHKELSKMVRRTYDSSKKLNSAREKLRDTSNLQLRDEKDLEDVYQERLKDQKKQIVSMFKAGQITKDQAKRMNKDLDSEITKREELNDLAREGSETLQRERAYRAKAEKLHRTGTDIEKSEEIRGKHGQMMGAAKRMFSAGNLKDRLGAAKDLRESSKDWKILKETMLGAGKGATGLAGTMKLLGMAFQMLGKLNWIALIISAVMALAKAVNELDKFIKEYNQAFAKMYGPTVAIKNVRESMKEFTNAVFDMNRNLKYGLDSKEILALFEAMSAGGLSLQGVGRRVKGGYSDVILEATKMSRDFGVGLEEMGGMIAEQMLDLRSSLDEVSSKMSQLAYDASVAGVKSTKFYEAAMGAASGLSFFGNYIDSASNRLRDFVKTGSMGFKDATKAAQDLTNTFANMTFEQRMATITTTGGLKKWQALFAAKSKAAAADEADLTKQLDVLKKQAESITDNAEKEKKLKEIAALQDNINAKKKIRVMTDELSRANEMGMASGLEYLSEEGPKAILDAIASIQGLDLWKINDFEAAVRSAEKLTGINRDTFMKMRTDMVMGLENARSLSKDIASDMSSMSDDVKKSASDVVSKYMAKVRKGQKIDLDELKGELKAFMSDDKVEKLSKQIEDNGYLVEAVLKGASLDEASMKRIVTENFEKPLAMKMGMGVEDRDKRIDDLVKSTTPIEKFLGISAENLKYIAAGSGLQEMASRAAIETTRKVGGIFGLLQRWMKGDKTTNEEYMGTDDGKLLRKLVEEQQYAQARAEDAKQRGDTQSQGKFEYEAAKLQGSISAYSGGREELIPELQMQSREKILERVKKATENLDKIGSLKSEISGLQVQSSQITGKSDPRSRQALLRTLAEKKATLEALQRNQDFSDNAGSYNPAWGSTFTAPTASMPGMPSVPLSGTVVHDFMAMSDGFQRIKKGDMVIDSGSLAKGVAAGSGQMISRMAGTGVGGTTVTVPISLQIGSVNGDVDDLVKKITPAIEQSFTRMFFEKQKRK